MENLKIKCDRVRACKWQGKESDLVKKLNSRESKKHGILIHDLVCPKCECKTMIEVKT